MPKPAIRRLLIRRFRGIKLLIWKPGEGMNLLVGPADSGKSTVLEALSLLFSSAPNMAVSEFDYYNRDVDAGFSIEAVVAVDPEALFRGDKFPSPPLRGWAAGEVTDLPDEGDAEPVLVCSLTASPEFDLSYEVIGAGDEVKASLSRVLRQRLGLVMLGVAERGDRDLRLVYGGALARYLQDQDLRNMVLRVVVKTPLHDQLSDDPRKALGEVEKVFKAKSLPNPVRLGLIGTPGVSLAASVGLTIGATDESALPLTAWGTGTRRLAALEVASLNATGSAIAVVDEPETGLEPYRQRGFITELAGTKSRQAFVTTHSPAVVAAGLGNAASIWRMKIATKVTAEAEQAIEDIDVARPLPESNSLLLLRGKDLLDVLREQPEALLARLPVVCEGVTEVGFAHKVFEHRFGQGYQARGIYCLDAGGHYRAGPIAKQLALSGLSFAAVVDDEGTKSGLWAELAQLGAILRWENGACLETAILSALPDELLVKVPQWAELVTGREERHNTGDIRRNLDCEKGVDVERMLREVGRDRFLKAVCEASCPKPTNKKKPRGWFKSFEGGEFLAAQLLRLSPRPGLMSKIDRFLGAVEERTG